MSRTIDRPARRIGGTAVVVGASMAGLCAARVLSERVDEVVVLDRDTLPDGAESRGQVLQGRQPHLLLVTGARLRRAGSPASSTSSRRPAPSTSTSAPTATGTRAVRGAAPGVDAARACHVAAAARTTVRRRVEALPRVSVRDRTAVEDLRADRSGTRVTGVHLGDGTTVPCDLMVDATGRQARSPAWLAALDRRPRRSRWTCAT